MSAYKIGSVFLNLAGMCGYLYLLSESVPLQAQTLAISGHVLAAGTETPIVQATVLAIERKAVTAGAPSIFQANTTEDGQFEIDAPAGASYSICVNASGYLNPCQWAGSPTITVGATNQSLNIDLKPGVPVRVRLVDSLHLLDRLGGNSVNPAVPAPPVAIHVRNLSTGADVPLPFAGKGADSVDYFGVIPDDPSWQLSLVSSNVHLADAAGRAYVSGALVSVPAALPLPARISTPVGIPTGLPHPERRVSFTVVSVQ